MPESFCQPPHTFHIPVMGTGFSIDTPLHVARYGISSVISLVDDFLIERMRQCHSGMAGERYVEIKATEEDSRARRITEYLNLVNRMVIKQVAALRKSSFEDGSEITKYFEMLPDNDLRRSYESMLATDDAKEKKLLQDELRKSVKAGSIDVNIMTKLDCERYKDGELLPAEFSDAKTALRGFANSELSASIVCSAGMNRGFYKYIAKFDDFFPDSNGELKKKIILKVSDFRSSEIQGVFLAKHGLWVSEYRVESGLNCGGHAFATKGLLLGPIMGEFRDKRAGLIEKLTGIITPAIEKRGRTAFEYKPQMRLTIQGGIGTAGENEMFHKYYSVDGTGWGTPFLLVPEVVNIDEEHLEKTAAAGPNDVFLSTASPMGVPFWNLRNCASEENRKKLIAANTPGSICRKAFLTFDTTLTEKAVCRASSAFQKKKLAALESENHSPEKLERLKEDVLSKACICHDLAGGATIRYGIDPDAHTALCCGPNIVNFSNISTLQEMVDHIYGRISLLTTSNRSHVFVSELKIYLEYLNNEFDKNSADMTRRTVDYLTDFKGNLLSGIEYYKGIAEEFIEARKEAFLEELTEIKVELETLEIEPAV